jgi:hypothetical protein
MECRCHDGSGYQLEDIAQIVLVFWSMVNVHMHLLICVVYNKPGNSSDRAMWKGWLMIDKWNGRIKLGGLSLPNQIQFQNFTLGTDENIM